MLLTYLLFRSVDLFYWQVNLTRCCRIWRQFTPNPNLGPAGFFTASAAKIATFQNQPKGGPIQAIITHLTLQKAAEIEQEAAIGLVQISA